jgi:protein TonB
MENKAIVAPPSDLPNSNNLLLIAILVAVVAHIIFIMGVNFSGIQPVTTNKAIEITLVNPSVKEEPEKADFLAPDNQLGAGEEAKKSEPPPQKLPSKESRQEKQINKMAPEVSKPKALKKVITHQDVKKSDMSASKDDVVSEVKERPQLTPELLQQQLAQLGTEIRQSQPSADQTKIKFVDSVSAHKYVAAQYMKDWESKVERTGNLNYPEAAAKKNFSGTLTMDVGIKADGTIYSIRINKSSGSLELDDAAIKIVRMSAPFPPLPLELMKELDVLVITRVWKFSDESGLVTR